MKASKAPSPDHNVVTLFERQAERVPNRPALIDSDSITPGSITGGTLSFAELRERSLRLAASLHAAGMQAGDRVIVMIPMSSELYQVLLALWRLGAVAVFADPWVSLRQMASMAAFAEPRAFIGTPASHLLRLANPLLRRLPITVTTGRLPVMAKTTLRSLAESPYPAVNEITAMCPQDSALVTFSGGSSGSPKGADRTHAFLCAQHRVLGQEFPHRDGEVELTSFPIFALHNLALGLTTVLPAIDLRRIDRFDATAVLHEAIKAGVDTLTASPPFFDQLAAQLEKANGPYFRPRRLLSGGAAITDAQLRSWLRAFPRAEIVLAYGSTEAEPVAHMCAEERLSLAGSRRGYCVGRPVSSITTSVDVLDGAQDEAIGELLVSGQHVCRDYFRNPRAFHENKLLDSAGDLWHRMGDTGSFDDEGRFWIAGRVHSTIYRDGRAVHAQLVEQAARGGDIRIRRAAAVGIADEHRGQRVIVVLELADRVWHRRGHRKGHAGRGARQEDSILFGVKKRLLASGMPWDDILIARRPLPLDSRHRSKVDYARLRRRIERGQDRSRLATWLAGWPVVGLASDLGRAR